MRAVNVSYWGATATVFLLAVACSSKKEGSNLGNGGNGGSAMATGGSGGGGGHANAAGTSAAGGDANTAPPCASIVGITGDCGTSSTAAVLKTPNILVLIDKSGSMEDPLVGASLSKWEALNTALGTALNGVASSVSFGLELFPGADVTSTSVDLCSVPTGAAAIDVPIGDGNTTVPQILTALGAATPAGGTPTSAALARAYDYFTTGAGKDVTGEKFVLLATDGGPNCNSALPTCDATHCTTNLDGQCGLSGGASCCSAARTSNQCLDDQEVITQLGKLATAGIPTFVVGLPGTEVYASYLDAFAVAGGKPASTTSPKYYAVSATGSVDDLTAVFQTITTQLIHSCNIQLSADPPDPAQLNVAIDCEVVPSSIGTDAGTTGGWNFDSTTSPGTIVLEGSTCDYIQNNGAKRIDVVFGCPTVR